MARLPRLYLPGQPQHVIQRGAGGQHVFSDDADYRFFSELLRDAARENDLPIHAYALMPSHLHLLATPPEEKSIGRVLQAVGRRYVQFYNRRMQRTGSLWDSRYRSTIVADDRVLLCSLYIELNPVRAKLASDAKIYPWSSCAHHLGVAPNPLVTDHALYWALGNTPFERHSRYRILVEQGVPEAALAELRDATNKGWAFGSSDFVAGIGDRTNRRPSPRLKGRPRSI